MRWPSTTELVGVRFSVKTPVDRSLYSQYTIGLHAWFLQQMQRIDPELSAMMHDGETEKPFTLTGLSSQFAATGQRLAVQAAEQYDWQVTALSRPVVQGLATWLKGLPPEIGLKGTPLSIEAVTEGLPPTTYAKLWKQAATTQGPVSLSFLSPTSFRRKGHHFPLPVPTNLFHSYLRRWNTFAKNPFEADLFLEWVDERVVIQQVRLESAKVAAGKRGSVTGFRGALSLSLNRGAEQHPEFRQLFYALVALAPYCGTGHKTTFGLGQTQLGWAEQDAPSATREAVLAQRIEELTEVFFAQRKRGGGTRAIDIAEKWATVLARREMGEALDTIAADLEIPYSTAKTYSKLARRAFREIGLLKD